jgi:hypothetical protein
MCRPASFGRRDTAARHRRAVNRRGRGSRARLRQHPLADWIADITRKVLAKGLPRGIPCVSRRYTLFQVDGSVRANEGSQTWYAERGNICIGQAGLTSTFPHELHASMTQLGSAREGAARSDGLG